ncbi:MAG: germination protein YpeB [Clostridiales bacterium]|nr:germination protein YpeB [Clostridiales bacterium]
MGNVKLTRNVLTWTLPILMGAALIVSVVWGKAESVKAKEYEALSDEYIGYCVDSCVRCGRELGDAVNGMSLSLSKLRATSSREGRILALEDIVRESERAASCEGRLPQPCVNSLGVSAFFTRAGDYARSLSRKLLKGGELDENDTAQLEAMLSACEAVLKDVTGRIENGGMPAGTEEFGFYDEKAEDEPSSPELPALIYDGPFSESAEKAEPYCASMEEGTAEEAERIAEKTAGTELVFAGETGGRLPTYDFASADGAIDVSVTKNGLRPLYFMRSPKGNAEGVPDGEEYESLKKAALAFLDSIGYRNMAPSYGEYREGYALISFVWEDRGALVYNDLVKVWLDRETGETIGLDARNYLFCHREREWEAPKLTAEQAKAAVSENVYITRVRLALIPLTPMTEALCWEFTGELEGEQYVIYVNAHTGAEERVFRIVNDGCGEKAE